MNPCWNDAQRTGEPFFLGGREIGPGRSPFVIAEIGVNHDGSFDKARDLVHAARDAGADAAKFQMFDAAMLMSRDAVLAAYQRERGARDPREMLSALALSADELGRLAEECVKVGVVPIVTVFSQPLFEMARAQPWHAFKTASPDLVNLPLLRAAASQGKPLIVSTGAATRDEVAQAAEWLADVRQLAFLQCTSSYPARDDMAAIGAMHEIRALTGRIVGYSDHTASLDTGALAVAAGGAILEKHLTYDRSASGPDHAASLDPAQFAGYVALARRAARMVGGFTKELQDVERDVRAVSRQSLVAVRDLPEGHVVTPADLCVKRPGTGICASRFDDVVGRRLARAVEADRVLERADIAWPVAAETGL
ncbi:MAG: N-acetylneuraminate synthase family protein [Planctomycetaceae bacterium]|nr:N-acetylneuraminate synthase family protein [Planctomycetaceae bacterium]